MSKSRNFVFTCNNYEEKHGDLLDKLDTKYMIVGKEVGESGTPHMQGYLVLKVQKTLSALIKCLPGFHLEVRKGSHDQARDYCMKEGDFTEIGTPPLSPLEKGVKGGVGEKERWELARSAAKSGNLDDIPADIYTRYYRTLKEIKKDHMVKPADGDDVCGTWYYGEAGAGKSRAAREDFPDAYDKMCNKWWDGYQLEENVIIDDLDKNHSVLAHHLKIWTDRYSFLGETKGGAISIRPSKICVTSQYSIDDVWEDQETRDALHRRFKSKHFVKDLKRKRKEEE